MLSVKDRNDWKNETNVTFSVVLLKNASSVSEINKKIRLCGIHKINEIQFYVHSLATKFKLQ